MQSDPGDQNTAHYHHRQPSHPACRQDQDPRSPTSSLMASYTAGGRWKNQHRKEDLANGSIISSCEVAKQLSAHRNRNGVFALAPDNYNDYPAYQCYQCPRHGPLSIPPLRMITELFTRLRQLSSPGPQQCPAVSSSVCVVINNNVHSARIVLPIVPGGGSP